MAPPNVPGLLVKGRRAVFLDRDGCINSMVYLPDFGLVDSPQNPDQFQLLPGVAESIRSIKAMGFLAVVVSNQPGIAKGKSTPALVEQVTQTMHRQLAEGGAAVDAVYYCLHHPEAVAPEYRLTCACRKPQPGLLLQAADDLGIDLGASFMVGDGLTDVQAGNAAGCSTIFLGVHRCDVYEVMARQNARPDYFSADLRAVAEILREHVSDQPTFTTPAKKAYHVHFS
ncbi:MAG: HAD family hydrolase [Chloroflexi bacterium]|nr:HAD family hydrolase [Chloroflexota bacterium]